MSITETSLRRPVTTLMVFVCFVVIGGIAIRLLPLEFFPDMSRPFMDVEVSYPGSSPEEIDREITRPAEEALATISGIKHMVSGSYTSSADIELEFDWGVDSNIKALEVKEKLDGIRHLFPDDLERFVVDKFSPSDMELLTLRISSNRDLSNGYDLLNRNLKRRVERIDGVSRCTLYGVEKKEIRIRLLADRIVAHRIDLGRLTRDLRRSNFLVTAGKITDVNRRYMVRPIGEFQSVEEIKDLIVGEGGVRLRDVAEITYDHPVLTYGRHLDRRYAIGLDVFKESGANTVDVARRILDEIDRIGELKEMEGIRIYTMENQADGIISSLNELLKSGLLGGLFAVLVLYFFLRRLSTTIIVSLAVPFSLLITVAFMFFMNISLNILSMMGLMLAVGMLVDNAVVVTESIHRHQSRDPGSKTSLLMGVREVALAITAGTLTTAIVFVPNIVSPKDETSLYMKHVAITICIALGASLVLAQTIVPLLASRVKPPPPQRKITVIDRMTDRYQGVLRWTLEHRWTTVGLMLLVLGSVAVPMNLVEMDMFYEPKDRILRLHYNITGNYTLEKVEAAVDVYEEYLFDNKDAFDIESVYSYYRGNEASSTILLKKGEDATMSMDEITEAIRAGLPRMALADPAFEYRRTGGQGESVRILLIGQSSERLAELSKEVAWSLSQVEGLTDVRSDAETGSEEVRVKVRRDRARQYGFTPREVAGVVASAMRGVNLRRFRNEEGEILMRLEYHEKDKKSLDHLRNLPLYTRDGLEVKLASVADFVIDRGPRRIRHDNRVTSLGVYAYLKDMTVTEAKEKIGNAMNQFNFPAGYRWSYGQVFDREEETFNTMVFNLLLALALIYFVMASLFESLLFPAAIWTQVLFAVVGVYWFFLATGTIMSIMGMIGILILIGVVVNNGIVLIDYVIQLRGRGMSRNDAILQAGRDRLRPILMTAATTVLSLIPLCVITTQIGGGGPPYFPMARAIVGGLAFSTVVTLLVLPTIYLLLDDLRNWGGRVLRQAMMKDR